MVVAYGCEPRPEEREIHVKLRIRLLALVPAVALVLSACGDDAASEEDYVDAMTSAMSTTPTEPLSEDKAECVAEEFVDRMGVDRLEEGGGLAVFKTEAANMTFTSIHLTEVEANDLFDDFVSCGADMRGRVLGALGDEDMALPEGMMDCLKGAISQNEMRAFFVPMLTNGETKLSPAAEKKLLNDVDTCMSGLIQEQG